MEKIEEDKVVVKPYVKSFLDFQKKLIFYEKVMSYLIITNAILIVGGMIFLLSDPIVIMERDAEKLSFKSTRKEVAITENEIKKLVENFIRRRYEWDQFSLEKVMANLSPLLSASLRHKVADELAKEEKSSGYQAYSQYIGKISITIDADHNIVGTFDKILRIHSKINSASGNAPIEKIPLLAESQVMVKVIKGSITEENPLGLYINGVINYEPR